MTEMSDLCYLQKPRLSELIVEPYIDNASQMVLVECSINFIVYIISCCEPGFLSLYGVFIWIKNPHRNSSYSKLCYIYVSLLISYFVNFVSSD